jgi:lambda repressor-like predicted transcriptional regulator
MKYFISMAVLSMLFGGANAAQTARPSMVGKMVTTAPRYTASVNQLNGTGTIVSSVSSTSSNETAVDRREAERNACINNNIGIGNTFVWASRYSNTSNYASMNEDINNPENNVCFVRVELKSDDSKISVSDVPAKYFMWGEHIECGAWANEQEMEKRILDAKKGARIGGIVASTVGGAGLGVGVMELFGNKAIGGAVEGQKALSGAALYKSKLYALQNSNDRSDRAEFDRIVAALKTLKTSKAAVDSDTQALIDTFAN